MHPDGLGRGQARHCRAQPLAQFVPGRRHRQTQLVRNQSLPGKKMLQRSRIGLSENQVDHRTHGVEQSTRGGLPARPRQRHDGSEKIRPDMRRGRHRSRAAKQEMIQDTGVVAAQQRRAPLNIAVRQRRRIAHLDRGTIAVPKQCTDSFSGHPAAGARRDVIRDHGHASRGLRHLPVVPGDAGRRRPQIVGRRHQPALGAQRRHAPQRRADVQGIDPARPDHQRQPRRNLAHGLDAQYLLLLRDQAALARGSEQDEAIEACFSIRASQETQGMQVDETVPQGGHQRQPEPLKRRGVHCSKARAPARIAPNSASGRPAMMALISVSTEQHRSLTWNVQRPVR